jgi:hypothetical protein
MSYSGAMRFVFCGLFLSAISLPSGLVPDRLPEKPESASEADLTKSKVDVCSLLTGAEIEAVQGEPVSETKASVRPNGDMLVSECLFRTANFAKSVSVALATTATASAKSSAMTPRKFWQKQFRARGADEDKTRAAGTNVQNPDPDGEEGTKPRHIEVLGEDAYWVGSPITGALYVLQGDMFVRISVGGVGDESARIEKSKVLARAVVKRL